MAEILSGKDLGAKCVLRQFWDRSHGWCGGTGDRAGDPELLTRYSLAVFFFATDGPNWTQCGAPTDPTDPASIAEANANCNLEVEIGQGGTQAWLTPVPICEWGALQCSIDGELVRIEFGKFNP